jgi:CubicO group peptidase (beta-lactamase class C family)
MVCFSAQPASAQAPTDEYINDLATRAMERFDTPGIAIGVLKDDEIVYAAGHGVRDIGAADPIDADTIFQIASLTKAFTTAALGILLDDGKLQWDDRVIDYVPEFRMYDAWVTREFTIRDLLTHRSGLGLGAGDLLFWPNQDSTTEDVLKAMRYLKPETSFRTAYAYDNLLYVIAGEVVTRISGMPWADFVEQRIMQPLGMDDCRALPSRVTERENRATPHMLVNGKLETTLFSGGGVTAAAGAVNCNVTGLLKWAAMHLADGALPDGSRLISEETHADLWKPVTLTGVDKIHREHSRTHFRAYALGWGLQDYFGYLQVSHSGGLQGMTTHITFLPEKDLAVIVLTNQFERAYQAVADGIMSAYIVDEPEDWIDIFGQSGTDRTADAEREVEEAFANRDADSRPSLPLSAYAGTYTDDWYGDVTVTKVGDELIMHFTRSELMIGSLEHFQYDTFVARWRDRSLLADAYATFSLGADGQVESIKMRWVSPLTDFSYDFHHLDLRRQVEK